MAPDPTTLTPAVDAPQHEDRGQAVPPAPEGREPAPRGAGAAPPPPPPPAPTGRSARRSARRARSSERPPRARRARRVKRIIRRVELWSVLKVSLVFYLCMYAAALGSLALLWGFAYSAGLVDNFESFMKDVGFENWRFYGEEMFRRCAIIGAILVLTGALLTTLAAALLNVISELTGGIRVIVIEEDPLPAPRPAAAPVPVAAAVPPATRGRLRSRRDRRRRGESMADRPDFAESGEGSWG